MGEQSYGRWKLAYEIENSTAIYPRIVIDSELINECFQLVKNMFYKPVSLKEQIYNSELLDELNMLQLFSEFHSLLVRAYFSLTKSFSANIMKVNQCEWRKPFAFVIFTEHEQICSSMDWRGNDGLLLSAVGS